MQAVHYLDERDSSDSTREIFGVMRRHGAEKNPVILYHLIALPKLVQL